jgi:hypothetical protein
MKKDWKLIRRIKSGHSYWRREQDGVVGIADDSGTYPEDCEPADRPPLLLDRTRPVHLGRDATLVPVKHDDGDLSHTPVGPFEAMWVATQFHMVLRVREHADAVPWEFAVMNAMTVDDAKNKSTLGSLRAQWLSDALKGIIE